MSLKTMKERKEINQVQNQMKMFENSSKCAVMAIDTVELQYLSAVNQKQQ